MRKSTKSAVVAGTVLALTGGGIAFAAWTSTGSTSGSVTSTTDSGLTVTSTSADGLFPTGSQTVTVTVANKNPYKVALDDIQVTGITASNAACNVGSVTSPNNSAPGATLAAAGASGASQDFNFVVSMSNDANDLCQGNTFKVGFKADGHSSN